MKIRVMYFASFRELTGLADEAVELPEGSRVKLFMETIKTLHEPLRGEGRMLVAVNGKFAKTGLVLRRGDVVALFPPVSGG